MFRSAVAYGTPTYRNKIRGHIDTFNSNNWPFFLKNIGEC